MASQSNYAQLLPPKSQRRYEEIRDHLRQQITSGKLAPGTRLPPETEMLGMLDASNSTIRRALRDLVEEGLIIRTPRRGSFIADPHHRPLIPGRRLNIGVLLPKSARSIQTEDFHKRIVQGIMRTWNLNQTEGQWSDSTQTGPTWAVWERKSKDLIVTCLGPHEDSQANYPPLDSVRESRFDGLITLSVSDGAWLRDLVALDVPTVIADYPEPEFEKLADTVFVDPTVGYHDAVEFYAKRGAKRIHFVGLLVKAPGAEATEGLIWEPDNFIRKSAYEKAMAACGLEVRANWIHAERHSTEACRNLARRLMDLAENDRPEVVICHAAVQAEAIISQFREQGIPLEGAGTGRRPLEERLHARDIRSQPEVIGATAAELLVWRLKDAGHPFIRTGVSMQFDPEKMP